MMPPGRLVALLGQNGSGKTTLVHTLAGLVSPTHGEAFIFGLSVRSDIVALRGMMGLCSQVRSSASVACMRASMRVSVRCVMT